MLNLLGNPNRPNSPDIPHTLPAEILGLTQPVAQGNGVADIPLLRGCFVLGQPTAIERETASDG